MFDLLNLSEDYTLIVVAAGAALLGTICGMVGTLTVLKRQSLMVDTISHACLPGVVIAFIIAGAKSQSVFIAGASVVGWLVIFQIYILVNRLKFRTDSAFSLLLSVYFGFGIVLMSYVQHKPGYAQAGLETFFYGQAATMLIGDVKVIAILAILMFLILMLFWKDIIVVIFDPLYALGIGVSVIFVEFLLSMMLVSTVAVGIQTAGVVLMSALIIAPAAAARQWTDSSGIMVVIAAIFGAVSGIAGSVASNFVPKLPTGPAIVVFAGIIVIVSMLIAPKRGLVWKAGKNKFLMKYAELSMLLDTILLLSLGEGDKKVTTKLISAYCKNSSKLESMLATLKKNGMVDMIDDDTWVLTESGKIKALESRSKHLGRAKFEVLS